MDISHHTHLSSACIWANVLFPYNTCYQQGFVQDFELGGGGGGGGGETGWYQDDSSTWKHAHLRVCAC